MKKKKMQKLKSSPATFYMVGSETYCEGNPDFIVMRVFSSMDAAIAAGEDPKCVIPLEEGQLVEDAFYYPEEDFKK